MENTLEKPPIEQEPSKEKFPFNADLRVDFIRHGKAEYSEEELVSARFEGELSKEGKEQIIKTANELIEKIDKEKELIVIWHSPRKRAKQSAKILEEILEEQKISVLHLTGVDSLKDIKMAPEFFQEFLQNPEIKDWINYWKEKEELPIGTEKPREAKIRVARVLTCLERIARKVRPKEEKKLHLILVGHEDIFLLKEIFGKDIENLPYAGHFRVDLFKSSPEKEAILEVTYGDKKGKLYFDPKTRLWKKEK